MKRRAISSPTAVCWMIEPLSNSISRIRLLRS